MREEVVSHYWLFPIMINQCIIPSALLTLKQIILKKRELMSTSKFSIPLMWFL